MATRSQETGPPCFYEDFQPVSDWVQEEEGNDTFRINLPGFIKEQITTIMDGSGNLTISGERHLKDNRWSFFEKEIRIPDNCITEEITTKFEDEIFYIIMPKIITRVIAQEHRKPTSEAPPSQEQPCELAIDPKLDKLLEFTDHKAPPIDSAIEETNGQSSNTTDAKKVPQMTPTEKEQIDGSVDARKVTDDHGQGGGCLVMGLYKSKQLVNNILFPLLLFLALAMLGKAKN